MKFIGKKSKVESENRSKLFDVVNTFIDRTFARLKNFELNTFLGSPSTIHCLKIFRFDFSLGLFDWIPTVVLFIDFLLFTLILKWKIRCARKKCEKSAQNTWFIWSVSLLFKIIRGKNVLFYTSEMMSMQKNSKQMLAKNWRFCGFYGIVLAGFQ